MRQNESNDITVEKFVDMIREIVRDIIKEEMSSSHVEKCYNGIVRSINDDNTVANVEVGELALDKISNKTGVELKVNDIVRVYASSTTFSDAYIGVKLN